ncbi:MAG TPA: WYL domain-containing protein [Acidimicrobiales bacterium]|nr:WYL domain-containing protein [Acidimicrobiales bacterium]
MPARERFDRLERMTNLVLVLLETTRPLTLREISGTIAGYPQGAEAARQAFERDKRALRALGIPLTMEPVETEQQVGYRIRPDDYYLPDLGLNAGEAQALGFAIAAVQLGGAAGADAIAKLGSPVTEAALGRAGLGAGTGPGLAPVAVLPSLPALGPIHEALRQRSLVRFQYHGREREVEPFGLAFRAGAWYLVGRDRAAAGGPARRTFRVDRLESFPSLGEPGAFEPPTGGDLHDEIRLLPWSSTESADEVPVAQVVVDARQARVVATQVPREAIAGWGADGSLRVRLRAGDREAFVSWAVGLGDTAVVEEPPELRAAVVKRLRELAGLEGAPAVDAGRASVSGVRATELVEPLAAPAGRSGSRRPAPSAGATPRRSHAAGQPARLANAVMAGERLRRLLAILVHLARVGEADLVEVADRFSIGEDELVHELELAACCGVPPYSPDELIELFVDGDRVVAQRLREFERPQRLTPDEGFVLAAAARALLSVPGADEEGYLRSALGKLEAALGSAPLAVELDQPEHLQELQDAARDRERVEIEYFSSSATAPGRREVDPYQVVLREGSWYLDGWCHSAGGLRRFQLDRVRSVRRVGPRFEEPVGLSDELKRPGAFLGGADAVAAVVAFPAGSELAVEQVAAGPIEAMSDGSGRLVATILVGDANGWFGRLLLRLGPGTEVLSPPELREAGVNVAQRSLRAYPDGLGSGSAPATRSVP